jgi:hypothetical protein
LGQGTHELLRLAVSLTAEHGGILASELGEGPWRPPGEIGDGVGDRYCFSARALMGTDSDNAFDNCGRNAFPNAARPRFLS